jgi:glycosyltransferase involved in cell wall biosynthesis
MATDSLRITHVLRPKPPGEIGGADLHVVDLAAEQNAQGHQARVMCLGPAGVAEWLRRRRVPHVVVDSMSMLEWGRALHATLRSDPPDVVHTHGYRADLVAMLVGSSVPDGRRRISATTVHGFIETSPALRLLTRANLMALRRADVVISVSSVESERLANRLRRPVAFIPNGVVPADRLARAHAATRLRLDASRSIVAFVGRLSAEKEPCRFVEMARILSRRHARADFVVIGSGPMRDDMQRQVAGDPEARVTFTGLVPDAASLLSAVDVLVCPSRSEGTPRVVIEAMLAGVAVVATRVGGLPDLLDHGETGILVEPGSLGALTEAVATLLGNPTTARAIGGRAREEALCRFSSALMARQTSNAYRSAPCHAGGQRR